MQDCQLKRMYDGNNYIVRSIFALKITELQKILCVCTDNIMEMLLYISPTLECFWIDNIPKAFFCTKFCDSSMEKTCLTISENYYDGDEMVEYDVIGHNIIVSKKVSPKLINFGDEIRTVICKDKNKIFIGFGITYDIGLTMEQGMVSIDAAISALEKYNNDIVNAILDLTT